MTLSPLNHHYLSSNSEILYIDLILIVEIQLKVPKPLQCHLNIYTRQLFHLFFSFHFLFAFLDLLFLFDNHLLAFLKLHLKIFIFQILSLNLSASTLNHSSLEYFPSLNLYHFLISRFALRDLRSKSFARYCLISTLFLLHSYFTLFEKDFLDFFVMLYFEVHFFVNFLSDF